MKKFLLCLLLMICNTMLFAQPLQELIFFGDSLTDNGNLYNKVLKIIPKSPPYYKGRFSNDITWAEQLVLQYGSIKSSNYAVGGATVILRGPWNGVLPYALNEEIRSYLRTDASTDRSGTLYLFWIGANDYLNEQKQEINALVTSVLKEIQTNVETLIHNGAKRFVLIDLPDLTRTPYAVTLNDAQRTRLASISRLHHQKMQELVISLQKNYPDYQFKFFNAYDSYNDILSNIDKYNKKYGFNIKNLTEACWSGGYTVNAPNAPDASAASGVSSVSKTSIASEVSSASNATLSRSVSLDEATTVALQAAMGDKSCDNPDQYLFWDRVHPTGVMHKLLGIIISDFLSAEFTK